MKVGIGALADVQATVDRCKRLGVERVFISCASLAGYEKNGYPDPASLREFKGRLEENGIEVPSVTYWFAKWPARIWVRQGATNPDILLSRDRRCIDAMLRMIEILGEVGITSVLHYVDFGKPTDAEQIEACWAGLIDTYRELIPVAESYGVGIGNHSLHRLLPDGIRERAVAEGVRLDDYGSYTADGWGGPFLVGTWKELRRLIDAVPSPCNGATLCTGMDIVGGDVPALVGEFAGRIHFCQLRDHTERWPAGREVPPGEGRLNFSRIVAALRDAGYQGILHPEHLGKPRHPGENLEAKAVSYVQSLLAALDVSA
ncbi:MAG: TIM barrel protein [Candidatus Poribacteria bacterium]|nr:TIM barrel protein [Candidatus Poribacteria bacterium]